MKKILSLEFMLYSLKGMLAEAAKNNNFELVRRLSVARTAVLLSLVEEQKKFISNRLAS